MSLSSGTERIQDGWALLLGVLVSDAAADSGWLGLGEFLGLGLLLDCCSAL